MGTTAPEKSKVGHPEPATALSVWQRLGLVAVGAWSTVLAVGFIRRWAWATALWPWPDGRLSYIFLGSILAAVAAASVWLVLHGDRAMVAPAALNVAVMLGGMSAYLFVLQVRRDDARLLTPALASGAAALASAASWWWAHGRLPTDSRVAPRPVRWSFAAFFVALVAAGTALVLRAPIFPWPLNPDTSVMFGWIFLGDACFFLYAVIRPLWSWAGAQLAAFLAYDLVLIPPLLAHIDNVPDGREVSLALYLGLLSFSAGVAVYYLFASPETRLAGGRSTASA